DGIRAGRGLKPWLIAGRRAVVPRTNFLAHVAPKQPVANAEPQITWDRIAQLDREIANAARGVEDVRRRKGLRGTGVEASPAASTVVSGEWLVVVEHLIG